MRWWDWFWYYRHGKVKYQIWDNGDHYHVDASDGKITVCNCYGSTREAAKEMALFRLKQAQNSVPKEKELVLKGEGFELYRDK
jgi:hypothetical protein